MTTFPSETRTWDSLSTAAYEAYVAKERADVFFEDNLLLGSLYNADPMRRGRADQALLPVRGNIRPVDRRFPADGLVIPVLTEQSSNTKAFRDVEDLPLNLDEVGTKQKAEYALYTDATGISRHERLKNAGPDVIMDLMEDRLYMIRRSLAAKIETHMWSNGSDTADGQPNVIGIRHFLSTDPTTGTVWAINRATYTWQRHNASNAAAAFATNGLDQWRSMYGSCAGESGTDPISCIVTTLPIWNAYSEEAESKQSINIVKLDGPDLAPDVLYYRKRPVRYSNSCVSGVSYHLNMRYMHLFMPPGYDFEVERYPSPATKAYSELVRLFFSLQWGFSRFDRQGVVYGFTDV